MTFLPRSKLALCGASCWFCCECIIRISLPLIMFAERQKQVWSLFNFFFYFHKRCGSPANYWDLFPGGKRRLRWIAVVSNVCFIFKDWFLLLFFLVACLISAEQLPKSLRSTGNGFGPRQAGVVFELATENEISVRYLPALCTSHSPPLLPPRLALRHTVVWICPW